MKHISFCKPLMPNFNEVEELLSESISSGHLSNFGPLYRKSTSVLKNLFKLIDKDVVITSSGHTALMTAYSVLGVKTVIVPDYTFISTQCAADMQGITTIVSDVDLNTGAVTPEILENINVDYDAVVVVCPLSTIPDLKTLSGYCKHKNKKLIIDGAATFGSSEDIYSYGDAYCMSFHATKTLSVGEGGAVILDTSLVNKAEAFITFGLSKNKDITGVGLNAKVSEYTCAILLSILYSSVKDIEKRREYSCIYTELLFDYMLPSFAKTTVYSSFPIYTPGKSDIILRELNKSGVQALKYYKPLVGLRNTTKLFESNVCLPAHHGLTKEDVLRIITIIKKYI